MPARMASSVTTFIDVGVGFMGLGLVAGTKEEAVMSCLFLSGYVAGDFAFCTAFLRRLVMHQTVIAA